MTTCKRVGLHLQGNTMVSLRPLSHKFYCISPSQFGLLESFQIVSTCLIFAFHVKLYIFKAQISDNCVDFQHAGSN